MDNSEYWGMYMLLALLGVLAAVWGWNAFVPIYERAVRDHYKRKEKKEREAAQVKEDLLKVEYTSEQYDGAITKQLEEWLSNNRERAEMLLDLFRNNHVAFVEPGGNTTGLLTDMTFRHRCGQMSLTEITKTALGVRVKISFNFTTTYLTLYDTGVIGFNYQENEQIRKLLPEAFAALVDSGASRVISDLISLTDVNYSNYTGRHPVTSFFRQYVFPNDYSDRWLIRHKQIGELLGSRNHTEEEFKVANYSGLFTVAIDDHYDYYDYVFTIPFEDDYLDPDVPFIISSFLTPDEIPVELRKLPLAKLVYYSNRAYLLAEAVSKMPINTVSIKEG